MVAELAAAFMCAELGIDGQLQHAEYMASWIKVLRGDTKVIFTAARLAQEATDLVPQTRRAPRSPEHPPGGSVTLPTEQDLDRARVEVVFGLGGGERHVADPNWPDAWDGPRGILYWYDGPPSYSEMKSANEVTCSTCTGSKFDPADGDSDCGACERMGYRDHDVRTAILNGVYGLPKGPEGWEQIAVFSNSGEADCAWCGEGVVSEDEDDGQTCLLREGKHLIYMGDGWTEVVYRRPT